MLGCINTERGKFQAIPASSDTVESEGWQMKQCLISYKKIWKFPFKISRGDRFLHVASKMYTKCIEILLTYSRRLSAVTTEYIFLLVMKQVERCNHRVQIFTRDETGLVCLPMYSAGAYTATLLVMLNVMKDVGVHPPPHTLTSLG